MTYTQFHSLGTKIATLLPALILLVTSASFAAPLHVDLDANESPPFWSNVPGNTAMGNEIIKAISKAAGIQTTIHFKPLSRMIKDDTNNDLGNPAFFMQNQGFAAIIPIAVYHISIFSYSPNGLNKPILIRKLQDLKGYKLGILKGTLINREDFKRAGIQFEESYSQESLFKKLQKRRIDLVIETSLVGHTIIDQLFPDIHHHFTHQLIPDSAAPVSILLAEQTPDVEIIAKKIIQGLKIIRENGTYTKIVSNYYPNHMVTPTFFEDLDRFSLIFQLEDN